MATYTADTTNVADAAMALIGVTQFAYIRPVADDGKTAYAVCAADGTQLAVFESQEAAFFTAKQHDLEPVRLH